MIYWHALKNKDYRQVQSVINYLYKVENSLFNIPPASHYWSSASNYLLENHISLAPTSELRIIIISDDKYKNINTFLEQFDKIVILSDFDSPLWYSLRYNQYLKLIFIRKKCLVHDLTRALKRNLLSKNKT